MIRKAKKAARKAARAGLRIGHKHAKRHWERYGWFGVVGGVLFVLIVVQLAYPWHSLPLFSTVEGVSASGKSIDETVKLLDDKYAKTPLALYFGTSTKAYRQPLPGAIGLTVSSRPQVDAKTYSFWLRLIPTSLFWAHLVGPESAPGYRHDSVKASAYVKKELGESCDVTPQNASLTYKDKKLQVVPAIDGGTCKLADVEKLLNTTQPTVSKHTVHIPMEQRPAVIHDDAAKNVATRLTAQTENVKIKTGGGDVAVPQDTFLSWLDFTAPDSGIVPTVNADRAADFLSKQVAPKVAVKPGTNYITTMDFTIVSQTPGSAGQALDTGAMIKLLNQWLSSADTELAAPTKSIAPTPVYTRHYSATDTGLSALIAQFAQAHGGDFGVSLIEITGSNNRRATYQDTKQFRTASTYKLFVAYSSIKRVERGEWNWGTSIKLANGSTKTLDACMSVMIRLSDNACGEALLDKISPRAVTDDIQRDIGLTRSSFMGTNIMTTAGDLTTFVGALYAGQLFKDQSNTDKLIGWMKQNIYRQGIPAGASGAVADKVGFLEDYLNDAAIVYSPSGTYALSIMSKGSSWATIAELTRQIEKLRAQ